MSSLVLKPLDPLRFRRVPGFSGRGSGTHRPPSAGVQGGQRLEGSLTPGGYPLPPGGGDRCRSLALQVLDGLLEVEGEDGFVSGFRAFQDLVLEPPGQNPEGATARLSLQALRLIQALGTRDRRVLPRRLYAFQSLPAASCVLRRLGWSSHSARFLDPDNLPSPLEKGWARARGSTRSGGWISWHSTEWGALHESGDPCFKLYVSPWPEHLPEAVFSCLRVLGKEGAFALKVASWPSETVRPDKLVAHFHRLEDVTRAADSLLPSLGGMEAQGVPFSVNLDEKGLLSWGMDPLRPKGRTGSPRRRSWRSWITQRLGVAMTAVPVGSQNPEPWEFALTSLSLQGIDDETFAPSRAWQARQMV